MQCFGDVEYVYERSESIGSLIVVAVASELSVFHMEVRGSRV